MKVTILNETTKHPISKMGEYAGICWGADTSDPAKNYKRGLSCLKSNHGRVLEYVDIEMCIEDVSARVIREWYTHLGGAPTRLQESTRYVDCTNFDYVIPGSVRGSEDTLRVYNTAMEIIQDSVAELENLGIKREDAAMILPLGMTTKIVDKRNLRNFIDMCHQRMCSRAFWEYRSLMNEICGQLRQVSEEWAYLVDEYFVPKCEAYGWCPEEKCCGRKLTRQQLKDKYTKLEEENKALKSLIGGNN